jgi:hypothetical protein
MDRPTFLKALEQSGNVSAAAAACGIHRTTAYLQRKTDREFAREWDEALEVACDSLEHEARRRALEGCDEPVFYEGSVCGHVRKYSDTLMIFLLKAHRPHKFRDNVAVSHSGDVTIRVEYADLDDPVEASARGAAEDSP